MSPSLYLPDVIFGRHNLDLYRKGTSPEQNSRAIRAAIDCGLVVVPSLIPFNPWSTMQRVRANLELLACNSHYQVNLEPLVLFNRLDPLAGSEMESRFRTHGFPDKQYFERQPQAYPFQDQTVASFYDACEQFFGQQASDAAEIIRSVDLELQRMREEMPRHSYLLRERLFAELRHAVQRYILDAIRRLAASDDCEAAAPAIARRLADQLAQEYRELRLVIRLPGRWKHPASK